MRERLVLAALLVLEVAAFALLSERFATAANALEVVRATAELGLIALASLTVEPRFNTLRSDRRYSDLLGRLNMKPQVVAR